MKTTNLLKKNPKWLLMLVMIVGLSSCGLFRKKNRCHTCPTWSYHQDIKTDQERI